MSTTVLHLKTQRGQPYGSERKCCERCGVMLVGRACPSWTSDEAFYKVPSTGFVPCEATPTGAQKGTAER